MNGLKYDEGKPMLDLKIVDAIIQIASLYDMQWEGYSIRALAAKGWETKVVFDDSILQDRQTNINEGVLLVGNGLMSKKRFLVEKLGYTEEEALQELEEIANEGSLSVSAFDLADQAAQEGQGLSSDAEPGAEEEGEEAAENES